MTASRRSRRTVAALARLALAAPLLAPLACRTPAAAPGGPVLAAGTRFAPLVPDVADHAAADVALAALASDRDRTEHALGRLRAIDRVLGAWEEPPTGLLPAATDVANAMLDDPRAYREASLELLRGGDLDPALAARLEQVARDDPLELADERLREAQMREFGSAFNTLAEPIGRSVLTASLAPYRLGRSILDYAVDLYTRDPLPLQRRQALAHWEEFLARHPDAPEAADLAPRVLEAELRLDRTRRNHAVRAAEKALAGDQPRLALLQAERALGFAPEDARAVEIRRGAADQLRARRAEQRRSLEAGPGAGALPDPGRRLALALLDPAADLAAAAEALLAEAPAGPLADEARFALALARGEAGSENEQWQLLAALARLPDDGSNLARHALALVEHPERNPLGAFRRARRRAAFEGARWVLVGPWFRGVRDRGLPDPVEWMLDLPAVGQSVIGAPLRLLQLPWTQAMPATRRAAIHARRYLERHPGGGAAAEVRGWLAEYEAERGNWIGALRVARSAPEPDPGEIEELEGKAAAQALDVAADEENRALRVDFYRSVARSYPETAAGRRAAELAVEELGDATPHFVRISRGFLVENPAVAGPRGLGLPPHLLDGEGPNGELHPRGAALLGGRAVELYFVAASGDEDDPPVARRERLDPEQLARLVALLEEASFRNALLDADDPVVADAQRDVFFERARLGLGDASDRRPTAEARFAYRGMRERYGMVRARESILPFDIVVQGSLWDLSLGAFPRFREPRRTPDSFLYR